MMYLDWLSDQDVWTQWLVRLVVTLLLVMVYQFYFSKGPQDPGQSVGVTTLEKDDWKIERLQVLEKRLASLEQQRMAESSEGAYTSQNVDHAMYESSPEDDPLVEEEDEDNVDVDPHDALEVPSPVEEEPKPAMEEEPKPSVEEVPKPAVEEESKPASITDATEKAVDDKSILQDFPKRDEPNSIYETKNRRRIGRAPRSSRRQQLSQPQPSLRSPIQATVDVHPGLDQFYHWYNVETSLYRIYELGRTDGVPVIPPFHPKSERGHVQVSLVVGNKYYSQINVFWVDYKGREVPKGRIMPGSTWYQQTWIGHPWTFRTKEGQLLLHYIPYRIIPTTKKVPTVDPNDPDTGIHQFVIGRPYSFWSCSIHDPVLPHHPEEQGGLSTPVKAAEWTLQHMSRTDYLGGDILSKYLTNIVFHPDNVKYRQIRTAQPKFFGAVWNTAARGLMLACGFVEREAYAELGTMQPLSRERVRDVSLLLFALEQWKREQGENGIVGVEQPEGADGFGRAGFGRAGQMNNLF